MILKNSRMTQARSPSGNVRSGLVSRYPEVRPTYLAYFVSELYRRGGSYIDKSIVLLMANRYQANLFPVLDPAREQYPGIPLDARWVLFWREEEEWKFRLLNVYLDCIQKEKR